MANAASRQYGQANPPFTATFIGFSNSDSPASLTGSLSCLSTATASSSVSGSPYQITCSGVSSTNYSITFAPGLLTISKANPSLTWANPANITQGTALGTQQLNATSNVREASLTRRRLERCYPQATHRPWSVIFTPSDAIDYNSASTSVLINVSPAALLPLTITAGNATQQYGHATPPLNNVTYSGFATGDTPAVLTGTLSCATTAKITSSVGTYPISCSGLSSTKYSISYVPGTLSVTPVPLNVTANNATRPFGNRIQRLPARSRDL